MILESNANFFYLFQLKYLGDRWFNFAKTAKCTSDKLYTATKTLQKYQASKELVGITNWRAFFFKCLSLWAYIQHLQKLCKIE